jgi:site-specific recombinase XerD
VRYCLEYFKKFVGKDYIAPYEITEDFLVRFKSYLNEHLNGETPHNYFTKMKSVVKKAFQEKILLNNTAANIKNVRKEGVKKDILNLNEIQNLANTECRNIEVKRAFLLCLNTGLRYCDILELKWQNIHDEMIIIKSQKKTGEPVYIDLNNNAKQLFGNEKGEYDEQVFRLPSFTGCLKILKAWTKDAGISKNITWHSARHSIAVNLLQNHTDIKTVSAILGHASLNHTNKYTRIVDELKKKAMNSLPNIEIS